MDSKSIRQTLDTAVGLVMVAYIAYAKITGDRDLVRLKQHVRYRWWKLTQIFRESSEPAWKYELREFNKEDGELRQYILVDDGNSQ